MVSQEASCQHAGHVKGRIAMTSEDVTKYLHGLSLPAAKNEIKSRAKHNGAPKEIQKEFDKLPWRTFQHEADIEAALKELGLLTS
jgi:hypothetical protein